jgi:IclR family acetate operon transcriptional repressor
VRLPESHFVARTMQALELLAMHPLSAPQVAEALEIHPRTARRLLTRLTEDGWLTRGDDTRRVYSPTLRIAALAGHVVERNAVAEAAKPFVHGLNEEFGAAAHLMVPSYRWVLCIVHGADGEPRAGLHELAPCHATATGKVLLAWRDAWRESVLAAPLERATPLTEIDPAAIRDAAAQARADGYATEDGEWRPGLRAVAAPVFAGTGDAFAALGVAVPRGRNLTAAGRLVAHRAEDLSSRLVADG